MRVRGLVEGSEAVGGVASASCEATLTEAMKSQAGNEAIEFGEGRAATDRSAPVVGSRWMKPFRSRWMQ